MKKVVVFDLGNVVFNFSHMKACAQIGTLFNMDAESVYDIAFKTGLWGDYERGDFDTDELIDRVKVALDGEANHDQMKHALADIFSLNQATVDLMRRLKEMNITIAALSNISPLHIEFLEKKWGIVDEFDHRFYSYELRSIKPEPKIFKSTIETLQLSPSEIIFADDMQPNVDAARSHGIDAVQFTTTDKFINDLKSRGIIVD